MALKVIAPEVADDPSFRDRFRRESRLAASIDHPSGRSAGDDSSLAIGDDAVWVTQPGSEAVTKIGFWQPRPGTKLDEVSRARGRPRSP